jgi:hypothetical protein
MRMCMSSSSIMFVTTITVVLLLLHFAGTSFGTDCPKIVTQVNFDVSRVCNNHVSDNKNLLIIVLLVHRTLVRNLAYRKSISTGW